MQEQQFPIRITKGTVLGAVFWILTLEFFVGEAIAQLGWKGPPNYSLVNNAISDLGVTVCGTVKIGGVAGYYCSPLHNVMNASLLLSGVFILLGVYFTRSAFPWNGSMRTGAVLLAIAGIGKITVGLNPANMNFTLHFLGALGIPLAGIGIIFHGTRIPWKSKMASKPRPDSWFDRIRRICSVFVYKPIRNRRSYGKNRGLPNVRVDGYACILTHLQI